MTETPRELHNRIVGGIVRSIVKPTLDRDGELTNIVVLLESVIAGVIVVVTKLGGDEIVMDVLTQGVKDRLAKLRLEDIEPKGRA